MQTASQCYRLLKDGEEKLIGTHNECFVYILRHQGQSVDYAMKYGGWKIEPVSSINHQTKSVR